MSAKYSRDHVKMSVAKILQTLGWHSINTTPLEVLTDILADYMKQLGKITNDYATEFGYTEPNLDHLGLAFREMTVNLQELEEYVTNVNFGPSPAAVPKYPLQKENNLNFLKPGSKEVVTRPVHIHEHLPPMYPLLEGADNENDSSAVNKEENDEPLSENAQVFKKPADVSPVEFKRARRDEEGSRPTREISSVMMTTSGFLSPAREGKLPEARTPTPAIPEPAPIPPPAPAAAEQPLCLVKRKTEKKKEKVFKELFKPLVDEKVTKKTPTVKDVVKMKQMKAAANVINSIIQSSNNEVRMSPTPMNKPVHSKVNKTLAAARLKTEKLNTTITPIPMVKPDNLPPGPSNLVGKLFTEPDKKKVNIFKKISNVKNEKHEAKLGKKLEEPKSRGSSPDLIIDEPDELVNKMHIPSDITIEPIIPAAYPKSPDKMDNYFDDGSPPGTPSTPRTPELISHSPPVAIKEKRKRKDSRRVRKIPKHQSLLEPDVVDLEMERPKTPEAHVLMKQDPARHMQLPSVHHGLPLPFPMFGGPGLIPPISSQMFPFPMNMHNFGKTPFLPPVHGHLSQMGNSIPMHNFLQPSKSEVPIPPVPKPPKQEILVPSPQPAAFEAEEPLFKPDKKGKEHKKEKKDKIKKKNKKDKVKSKAEKKKLKEEKKDKVKKEKKEKKKEKEPKDDESPLPKLFLKLGSPSPRPETPETIKKLNIKPILKKDEELMNAEEERKRETSPGLAKISALVTGPPKPKSTIPPPVVPPPAEEVVKEEPAPVPVPRNGPGPGRPRIHPLKTKPTPGTATATTPTTTKPKKRRTSIKKDEDGNEVWICPGCEKQDDGSPMIGCDGCDAWYHWVCVGIQVPPDENENWYCRHCLLKKNEDLQSDKKKKRRKREKKEH